jgi:ubiquinone/menaquinone biosynthesis C-methylase UbiE
MQLSEARGKVLEIGLGTGVNIPFYPESLHSLTTVDKNSELNILAQKRIKVSPLLVEHWVLNAEQLSMASETFDTVVSTMTLCSIEKVSNALQEIFRVLKSGGLFLFLEHGKSSDPQMSKWQTRLTPVSRIVGDGCHLDRNISGLIQEEKFKMESIQTFYVDHAPPVVGFMYQGIARKP